MALYDYQCKTCGRETEEVNRIAERHTNAPVCCGVGMGIVIKTAPQGYVSREIRFIHPVTNEQVTSARQRDEINAREGLVDANDFVNHKTIQQAADRREEQKRYVEQLQAEAAGDLKEVQSQVERWNENTTPSHEPVQPTSEELEIIDHVLA